MHFEAIRDFEWLNEPVFRFDADGLVITPAPDSDFWQDRCDNVGRDNGHFFYTRRNGNFVLDVVWQLLPAYSGEGFCGLMARIDAENWCRIVLNRKADGQEAVCVSVTNFGCSDLAQILLPQSSSRIIFRLQAQNGVLQLAFSTDGQHFVSVRKFRLLADYNALNAGACIYNSGSGNFEAVLADINFVAITDK